jgi:hypothetical protein
LVSLHGGKTEVLSHFFHGSRQSVTKPAADRLIDDPLKPVRVRPFIQSEN